MKYSVHDLAYSKGTSELVRAALLEMARKLNEQDDLLRQALEALETPIHAQPFGMKVAVIAALKEHLNAT